MVYQEEAKEEQTESDKLALALLAGGTAVTAGSLKVAHSVGKAIEAGINPKNSRLSSATCRDSKELSDSNQNPT